MKELAGYVCAEYGPPIDISNARKSLRLSKLDSGEKTTVASIKAFFSTFGQSSATHVESLLLVGSNNNPTLLLGTYGKSEQKTKSTIF